MRRWPQVGLLVGWPTVSARSPTGIEGRPGLVDVVLLPPSYRARPPPLDYIDGVEYAFEALRPQLSMQQRSGGGDRRERGVERRAVEAALHYRLLVAGKLARPQGTGTFDDCPV